MKKYIAKSDSTESAELVTIWKACKKKLSDCNCNNSLYYSLATNKPMIAKCGKIRAWSFAYKSGHSPPGSTKSGEGISHELSKSILKKIRRIKLNHFGKKYDLILDNVEPEWHFKHNDKDYFIDIVAEIKNKNELSEDFNHKIGIEIKVKHKVEGVKRKALRKLDFGVIEIEIWEKLHVTNPETISNQEIITIEKSLTTWFSRNFLKTKSLHNPNYRKYTKKTQEIKTTKRPTPSIPSRTEKQKVDNNIPHIDATIEPKTSHKEFIDVPIPEKEEIEPKSYVWVIGFLIVIIFLGFIGYIILQ